MSEQNGNETGPKKRKKRDDRRVENGIYQVGPNLYDVRVRKRIQRKQQTRFKRKVRMLTEARRVRNQFINQLEMEEQAIVGGNHEWSKAKEIYFEFRKLDPAISEKTFVNQQYVVNAHTKSWDEMRLKEIKRDFIIADFKSKLVGYPKSSVKTILKHVRAVFNHFKSEVSPPPIEHNPLEGVKPWGKSDESEAKEIPKMTMDEINKLLSHTLDTDSAWHPVFFVAYKTGMRSGELWALKWADISEDFLSITVKRSYCFLSKKEKPPKNGLARKVSVSKSLAVYLKELKLKSDSSYVLPHHPMWADGKIAKILREYQKAVKITQTNFHSIRASHITHLLLKGIPAHAVMYAVGHADYKTTDRYVREISRERSIENMTDVLDNEVIAEVIPLKKTGKP